MRVCALELYFGGLVVAWWWSRGGLGTMPADLKTGKWEEGFCSIQFLFKFNGFGVFWGSVRGGVLWGLPAGLALHTNTQTYKLTNTQT